MYFPILKEELAKEPQNPQSHRVKVIGLFGLIGNLSPIYERDGMMYPP